MRKPALLISIWAFSIVFSQNATVKGFVFDEKSGEPLFLVSVYMEGTNYGTITDENGFFVISRIPPGRYVLVARYLGYDTLKKELSLKEGDVVNLKLFLKETGITLKGVEIQGEKIEKETGTRVSYLRVDPVEIARMPSIGALPDVSQYIQMLPGVTFTGDRGGQIFIRGGAPIQNKFLLDGMTVFNPFHSIGIFSVLDVGLIRNMEVYRGGFNAEYGDRISSVIDISTIDGNRKRIEASGDISTMGISGSVQIPIAKPSPDKIGSSALIISAKHSWVEEFARQMQKVLKDFPEMPYKFSDLFGKLSLLSGEGHKLSFSGMYFTDVVRYKEVEVGWKNMGGSAYFLVVPPAIQTSFSGTFAYSRYAIDMREQNAPPRSNTLSTFEGHLAFNSFRGENHLQYGVDVIFFDTRLDFTTPLGGVITLSDHSTTIGPFLKYKMLFHLNKGLVKNVVMEPGFRLQYYTSINAVSPEPRIAAKIVFPGGIRAKGAWGLYSQNVFSATTDRDVVSIFPAIISGDVNIPDTILTKDSVAVAVRDPLQSAMHAIFGIEYDPAPWLSLEVEGYWKSYSRILEINRNKQFEDSPQNIEEPDILKKDFWVETGASYGIDFLAKWTSLHFSGMLSYSLAFNDRYDQGIHYHPVYDRRHTINTFMTWTFGEDLEWEASMRWTFGTGFPFTPTLGYYPLLQIYYPSQDYISQNEQQGTVYGKLLSRRLPAYHRLDISLSRIIPIKKDLSMKVVLSVVNVYNRKNIFYYDRISNEIVYQLPIVVSAGLSIKY